MLYEAIWPICVGLNVIRIYQYDHVNLLRDLLGIIHILI